MAERVKVSDAQILARVLMNPEQAVMLTPLQLSKMRNKLQDYQNQQTEMRKDLLDAGHDPKQADQIIIADNQAFEMGGANNPDLPTGSSSGPGAQAKGAARFVNIAAEGVSRAVEGLGSLATSAAKAMGIADEDAVKNYQTAVNANRTDRKLATIKAFGSQNNTILEQVAEVAPWMLSGGVGGAQSVFRFAAGQGLIGATAMGAQVSDKDLNQRLGDMALGGGLGFFVTGALGIPSATRAAAARHFMKDLNLDHAKANVQLEAEIQQMFNNGSFSFSLAQVTGNRFLFNLERNSAGQLQKAKQNENIDALFNNLLDRAKSLGDAGRSSDEIALDLRKTLSIANKTIHKKASDTFADGLEALQANYGDDIIMNIEGGQNYLFKIDELIGAPHSGGLDDALSPGPGATTAFKAYRAEVDRLVNPVVYQRRVVQGPDGKNHYVYDLFNRRDGVLDKTAFSSRGEAMSAAVIRNRDLGGFQAGEIRRIQEGLNDLLRGKTAVLDTPDPNANRGLAKALMGEFMANVDANIGNAAAKQDIQFLSKAYQDEMLRIGKMESLVINRVFGQAVFPYDTDALLGTILTKGEESSLRNTRAFLEEWDPALLHELQGKLLSRAAKSAYAPASSNVDTAVSLTKLAEAIAGPEGIGMVGKGLLPDLVQADLVRTGEALRTIKNLYFEGVTPISNLKVDDLVINAISRSPEFMGRFLARVLSGGKAAEGVLLDPLLRKSLQVIAEKGPTSAPGRVAMLTLSEFMTQEDARDVEEREQERKRDKAQQAAQAAGQVNLR